MLRKEKRNYYIELSYVCPFISVLERLAFVIVSFQSLVCSLNLVEFARTM